jgi:hypothetical protein
MKRDNSLPSSQGTERPSDPLEALLDEVGVARSASGTCCPKCRTEMPPNTFLCIKCGYNLETGQKLRTKSLVAKQVVGGVAKLEDTDQLLPDSVKALLNSIQTFGVVALIAAVVFGGTAVLKGTTPEIGQLPFVQQIPMALLVVSAVVAIVLSFVHWYVAGLIRQRGPLAHICSLILAIVDLSIVPIGTVFGALILKAGLATDTTRHFRWGNPPT